MLVKENWMKSFPVLHIPHLLVIFMHPCTYKYMSESHNASNL